MSKNRNAVKRIVHVSLLITLAVIIRNFSYSFYIGGVLTTRSVFRYFYQDGSYSLRPGIWRTGIRDPGRNRISLKT